MVYKEACLLSKVSQTRKELPDSETPSLYTLGDLFNRSMTVAKTTTAKVSANSRTVQEGNSGNVGLGEGLGVTFGVKLDAVACTG
jgi:hypothetical protein